MESYLTAEVSASAVAHNLELLRGRLAPGVKLCAVVKSNCYGLGVDLLLPTIAARADWLAVAAPVEAVGVRELGYAGPLLVFFSPCAYAEAERREALEELIRAGVTMTLTSTDELAPLAEAARRVGRPAELHAKVDSGMGRSGAPPERAGDLVEAARATGGLRVSGLYTHFATADEKDDSYLREQLRRFREAARLAAAAAGPGQTLLLHAANSAALAEAPEAHLNMARAGLAMYGYQPAERSAAPLPLRPALRVWGRLLLVKKLPRGAGVGYGLSCTLRRDSVVGLAPIGYADGYFRCLSNRATMRVNGRDAAVLGRVSMDQTVIDLTDCPGAKAGDVVEIISSEASAPHGVENLARLAGTIAYEVTCRLGPRARRVLVHDR